MVVTKVKRRAVDEVRRTPRNQGETDLAFLSRMHLLFQAVGKYEEEAKVVSVVFGRLVVKWDDKILELYPEETLNFVNLIDFFKTREKQEEYKGLEGMRSGVSQKAASTDQVPQNPSYCSSSSDVYKKKRENRPRCSICNAWDHTHLHCKGCYKCGKQGNLAHMCLEKGKPEQRGVNAAEVYKVDVGVPVPLEPMVILDTPQGSEGNGVNVVTKDSTEKKKLLHVKSWLGASRAGVDFLVDTKSACNLMSTSLCKRLKATMTPCTQALVSFLTVFSETVGKAEVEAQLGEWTGKLSFHVTNDRVQPILGYLGLKDLGMTVNFQEDCLHNKNGKKILCHGMRVKRKEQPLAGRSAHIKVTQTRDAKGSKVNKKGNRLLIPVGVPVVLGHVEIRTLLV